MEPGRQSYRRLIPQPLLASVRSEIQMVHVWSCVETELFGGKASNLLDTLKPALSGFRVHGRTIRREASCVR
jgi:hypothetical protein